MDVRCHNNTGTDIFDLHLFCVQLVDFYWDLEGSFI